MSFNKVLFLALIVSSSHVLANCEIQLATVNRDGTIQTSTPPKDTSKPKVKSFGDDAIWHPSIYEDAIFPGTCAIDEEKFLIEEATSMLRGSQKEHDSIIAATFAFENTIVGPAYNAKHQLDSDIHDAVIKAMNAQDAAELKTLKTSVAETAAKAESLNSKHNVESKSLKSEGRLRVASGKRQLADEEEAKDREMDKAKGAREEDKAVKKSDQ
jgi:hypothetical protein